MVNYMPGPSLYGFRKDSLETGTISLIVSGLVGAVTVLNFLNTISARKEAGLDKFAKAEGVSNELSTIRADLQQQADKLEDHGQKLSNLQVESAVLGSQMGAQLRAIEKINDKIDHWR